MKRLTVDEAMRHLEARARQRRTGDRKTKAFQWTDTDAQAVAVVLDALHARQRTSHDG